MRARAAAAVALAAGLAACGSEPLTPAQFDRAASKACLEARRGAGDEPAEIERAHARALRRIRSLDASAGARKRAAPALERLANQGRRLRDLVRAQRDGAPSARLLELAGAIELEQRLAGEAGGLRECLAIGPGVTGALVRSDYAQQAPRLLRRGRRVVADRNLVNLSDRDSFKDLSWLVYLPDSPLPEFAGKWRNLTPPPALADEHRAVRRAIDRMTDALGDAVTAAGDSAVPLSVAQRHLRRFPRERRDFHRASARLLRELG